MDDILDNESDEEAIVQNRDEKLRSDSCVFVCVLCFVFCILCLVLSALIWCSDSSYVVFVMLFALK